VIGKCVLAQSRKVTLGQKFWGLSPPPLQVPLYAPPMLWIIDTWLLRVLLIRHRWNWRRWRIYGAVVMLAIPFTSRNLYAEYTHYSIKLIIWTGTIEIYTLTTTTTTINDANNYIWNVFLTHFVTLFYITTRTWDLRTRTRTRSQASRTRTKTRTRTWCPRMRARTKTWKLVLEDKDFHRGQQHRKHRVSNKRTGLLEIQNCQSTSHTLYCVSKKACDAISHAIYLSIIRILIARL